VIELANGSASLLIDPEHGGRAASLKAGGRELLVPYVEGVGSIGWGCYLMAPWPGRLRDGLLDWDGRRYQLRQTLGRHAIHGVVYDRPWTVERATDTEAELSCELEPAGWPLGGTARQRFHLDADGLTLQAEVVADVGAGRAMPAALGWHPWFRRADGEVRIRLEADEVLVTRELIPTGQRTVVRGMTDLRSGPAVGRRRLDHAYADARSPAIISWPDFQLEVEFGPPLTTVVVHTPPSGLCVEPQTAWPDAFDSALRSVPGTGLARLEPGETLSATMRLRWHDRRD
jgi:aldose 1-epimerase